MGTAFNLENLNGSLSIYKSKKRNSIFRDSENFIIDNGKTNHQGIELTLDLKINETSNLISNFTYGDHKYDFNSDTSMREKIRIGNEIDTSPKLMANLILNTSINDNVSLAFELEHMDSWTEALLLTMCENKMRIPIHAWIHITFPAGWDTSQG